MKAIWYILCLLSIVKGYLSKRRVVIANIFCNFQ